MFCEKCGNKYTEGENFCIKCGGALDGSATPVSRVPETKKDERWWHRLANVVYVAAHLPLLLVVPLVWSENARRYSSYYKEYRGSDGEALWYCILTIVIWLAVLRLIKMSVRYVAGGVRPVYKDLLRF